MPHAERLNGEKTNADQLGFLEDEDGTIRLDDLTIPAALAPTLTTEAPDSRLVIHSLVVKNFKSYAGEQILGPFHKNFTAVVGPNGSGKSNVIDSLLFVFGYRAKKIRSKKVSHLIHKSDQHPDLKFCSVTVNFAYIKDEGEKGVIIPDSRFSLSRTAFADDSSYYEMCNRRVPYKDVSKTLRRYGIDLEHSRFLILQGEIEAISLMNPKAQNEHETGMLEYIEDIIGTNRFIEPVQHFKSKVEELTSQREEKLKELKLIEKEKNELEGPKNKAVEYLRLENSLQTKENSFYHLKRFEAEKSLQEAVESKQKFVDAMKSLKIELESLRADKKRIEGSLSKINSEQEIFQKKSDNIKEEYSKLEHKDAANLMQIKHSKEKIQKLESNLETLNKELSKLMKQSEVYVQETVELQEKKKKLEEEKEVDAKKMDEMMGSLQQETNIIQEKKDKLEDQLVKLKNNSYQIKSEIDLANSELKLINSEQKKEKEKLDNLISNHEKSIQSANSEEKLLKSESEKIKVTENEIAAYRQQLAQLKVEEDVKTQQLRKDRMKLEEARIAYSTLGQQGTLVKAFLKEKSQGRLTGVYGRLGDLGAIDEKYDVAVSTACSQLDNIVTDTLNTAQECVEFLKKNNLGYTTFIPLEKMKHFEKFANSKISTPENVPRLFDLIRVKDKDVLPAFYHALKNTLVAKDLEQATRIGLQGKQRYRVVTVKGELIDLSGTMSGGGGKVYKGRMGQTVVECSVTSEDVNKLSAEVNSLNQKLVAVKKQRLNLEEHISQKTSIIQSLQHSLKKRTMNLNAHKESINVLSSQITDQKCKCKETVVDSIKVKELENQIKERTKVYNEAVEKEKVVEKEVSKLQEEILQITKGKFSKVKKNFNLLEKKLSEVTQALTKSNVNTKAAKRNLKKIEEKIKLAEQDMKENKENIEQLRNQQVSLTEKGKDLMNLIEKNEVELSAFKEKKTELKKEMDAVLEKEHKLKLNEIEHKNQLKIYETNENEKRSFIKTINAKISKLKLSEVEDDPTDLPTLSNEEISKLSVSALTSEIDVIKIQLENMKPDLSSINEYAKTMKLYEEKEKELGILTTERNLQCKRCDYLSNRRVSEFLKGFAIVAKKLKEIYQMLTMGGDAEVELVDTMNPFTKGIEFSVRPPRKSWKYMRNLSGGEKTLSSLALVFALHYYRPTPFYVMDEIDAALDVRNVAIVGKYLRETTKNTEFIIVSLRNVMNELSDHLLGIYKTQNCTKNLNISYVSKWKEEEEVQKDNTL